MDSVTKNNTPAVRFEGFDGEWGAVELQQIADIVGGGTPSTSVTSFWDGDIDWYSPNEIGETAIAKPSNKRITRAGLANSSARLLPAHRTVLFTSRASIGHAAILDHPATTNQGFQSFVLNKGVDTHFFYALTSKIAEIAEQLATGSTFLEVSNKTVREIEVHVPATEEQRAIGELFSDLDALIEQHRAKHENLQQTKTALLQRMFPQDGADEPELRLGGFSGAWGTAELQDLAAKFTDGDWIESKDQSTGGIRLLQTGNVGVNQFLAKAGSEKWVSESTFHRLRCEEVLPGDILISRLPEPAGRACKVPALPYKMITAVDCTIVRTDSSNDPDFILAYLSTTEYFDSIRLMLAGGTRQRVSRSNLATILLPTPPTLEEQRAIGEVFSNLDDLIAAETNYITQLTQAKTALLQRMFV